MKRANMFIAVLLVAVAVCSAWAGMFGSSPPKPEKAVILVDARNELGNYIVNSNAGKVIYDSKRVMMTRDEPKIFPKMEIVERKDRNGIMRKMWLVEVEGGGILAIYPQWRGAKDERYYVTARMSLIYYTTGNGEMRHIIGARDIISQSPIHQPGD